MDSESYCRNLVSFASRLYSRKVICLTLSRLSVAEELASTGFEPGTFTLLERRSYQPSGGSGQYIARIRDIHVISTTL